MDSQQDAGRDPLEWQVESLRLTTFHISGTYDLDSTEWWETVTHDRPDQVVTRPREGIMQQSGSFEGRQLVLLCRPDRVDWHLQEMANPPGQPIQQLMLCREPWLVKRLLN